MTDIEIDTIEEELKEIKLDGKHTIEPSSIEPLDFIKQIQEDDVSWFFGILNEPIEHI